MVKQSRKPTNHLSTQFLVFVLKKLFISFALFAGETEKYLCCLLLFVVIVHRFLNVYIVYK